jgi:hypothetical protein
MLKTVGNPSTRYGDQTVVDGNIVIGTAGKGIDFSANPAAAGALSELLNDYEQGTWTPVIIGSSGNPTITYTVQRGSYVKVGNVVHLFGQLAWSANSGGGGFAAIGGFPFVTAFNGTVQWSSGAISESGINMTWSSGYTQIAMEARGNGYDYAAITQMGSAKDQGVFAPSALGASGYFAFQITYQAS